MSEHIYKCLVVAEHVGPRRWRASATVSVEGKAVAVATARGATRSAAVGSAGAQALEVAARVPFTMLKKKEA